jgi:hypothetical protein
MQIVLNTGNVTGTAQPPHFRGLSHLVTASFGDDNVFVFDLLRRTVAGTISEETAVDSKFWDRILLPIAIGVLGPAVGVVPVHAACVIADGAGVLIAGASGMGKSTLSVALAQHGFDYLSDDWTYLSLEGDSLRAHGMGIPAKLLPDAVEHFPLLDAYEVGIALNQEPAYELPVQDFGADVAASCEPRWFVFLERVSEPECSLVRVSSEQARRYVEDSVERLPSELEAMNRTRTAVLDHVARLSCWQLTYGGPPEVGVRALQHFFAEQRQQVPA